MSRNQFYFKCPICGDANQSKRPNFCRNCRAEFVYDGDSPTPTNTIPFNNPPAPDSNKSEPSPDGSTPDTPTDTDDNKEKKEMKNKKVWEWILLAILAISFIYLLLGALGVYELPPWKSQQVVAQPTSEDQRLQDLELKFAELKGRNDALVQQNQNLLTQMTQQQPATIQQQVVTYPTEPVIYAKYQGVMTNFGIYFDKSNPIGERITYTNRSLLIPDKAWNEKLTSAELRKIETTWVPVNVDLPEGASLVIFAGGLRQNGKVISNNGIYVDVTQPGYYRNIEIRNGEAAIWFNDQNKAADWERIRTQVQNGNFDIRHSLELTQIYK